MTTDTPFLSDMLLEITRGHADALKADPTLAARLDAQNGTGLPALNAETVCGNKPGNSLLAAGQLNRNDVTGNDLHKMADELREHYAPKTAAQALAAIKHASLHNVKRRPLVMKFHGNLLADELTRRFKLIGLEATSDCCGDVCVHEMRGNAKLERLELLRAEIDRLRAELDDEALEYEMDEQVDPEMHE